MMPPGAPPFPPNGMPPPGMGPPGMGPPGMGPPAGAFPPFPPSGGPPSGTMPPFAPKNPGATSVQMDLGSNMDNSREDNVAVLANGDLPSQPTIHPDRLRMMAGGTRP